MAVVSGTGVEVAAAVGDVVTAAGAGGGSDGVADGAGTGVGVEAVVRSVAVGWVEVEVAGVVVLSGCAG